jgi:uncharacterized protein (TIGR03067 family)
MTRFSLIAILVLAGGVARAADAVDDEVKKLQGDWQAVEIDARGKKVAHDDQDVKNMRFVFKDNGLTVGVADVRAAKRRKTFKLNEGKTPKQMDITSLDGQENGTTAACIYQLEKDRLTICMPYFTKDPSQRPTEFKAGADDGLMLITLERVKAK